MLPREFDWGVKCIFSAWSGPMEQVLDEISENIRDSDDVIKVW